MDQSEETTAIVPLTGTITATSAQEMAQSMEKLKLWAQTRHEQAIQSTKELKEEVEIAKRNKWRTHALKIQLGIAEKKILYYEKIKAALDDGYVPIPNLPGVIVFAHRVDEKGDRFIYHTIPAGEGRYAAGWGDGQPEFPMEMAKPKVMQASERAMALKIFDEVGMLPPEPVEGRSARRRQGDPLILGVIHGPSEGSRRQRMTFLVAWGFDLTI